MACAECREEPAGQQGLQPGVGGENVNAGRGCLEYKDRLQRSGRSQETKLAAQSYQMLKWMRPREHLHKWVSRSELITVAALKGNC